MPRQAGKIRQIGKSTRNDGIKPIRRLKIFDALSHYLDIFQLQFDTRLLQKSGFFMIAFDQRHTASRVAPKPVESRASQRHCRRRQYAVRRCAAKPPGYRANAGPALFPVHVPRSDYAPGSTSGSARGIATCAFGFRAEAESQDCDSFSELRRQTHALFFFFWPEKPRFTCTSNNEIAAGVMPEIRAACPAVSGLN